MEQLIPNIDRRLLACFTLLLSGYLTIWAISTSCSPVNPKALNRAFVRAVYDGRYHYAGDIVGRVNLTCVGEGASAECSSTAFSLIGIGKYPEALSVLSDSAVCQGADPYQSFYKKHFRYLKGEALIGMQDYQGAVRVLTGAEDQYQHDPETDFALAKAYLGLGRADLAAKHIVLMPNDSNLRCYNILSAMIKLDSGDKYAARELKAEVSKFYLELENCHDSEGIPNLEFASHLMKRKGFATEAEQLQGYANRLKRQ